MDILGKLKTINIKVLIDPSGKSDEEFIMTAMAIEEKVKDLAKRIKDNEINLIMT